MWENETTGELVCDTCHVVEGLREPTSRAQKQRRRREERHSYDDREEYDGGRIRLYGGYKRAYLSENGRQYAIDAYDDVTDGLWTPHDRGWRTKRSSPA